MEFKDYYQILGVEPDATTKAIKTAYRKLAHRYHPDMNPEEGSEAKFKEVAEAFQVLKDAKLRSEFDELREYGSQSQKGFQPPPSWQASRNNRFHDSSQFDGDFSEFFNSIFGNKNKSPDRYENPQSRSTRGQDIEIELPIFLEESLKEQQKNVEFKIPVQDSIQRPPLEKHLKVKIPQGVTDGERIRLKGQGKPSYQGGQAGDLYLHIRIVPHPLFDVSGHNINIIVPLAPWEAALGIKVMVPTLEGKINLSIPPCTQSGDKLRVKGKGLKNKGITGDMFAIVSVVMPERTSINAKRLWQELAKNEGFNPRKEWSIQR